LLLVNRPVRSLLTEVRSFAQIFVSKTQSVLIPLAVAGSVMVLPLATFAGGAHTTHQARLAAHAARLAKVQQRTAARQAKVQAQNEALGSGNVVQAAYAFRGTRYVMGGTSRSGFDCSGFVRFILSNASGVDVPRTAVEQYYHGAPIAPQDLQPGDLVFFKNTYKHGISHVGIYAGEGKFIHAANKHEGVRMDDLSKPYFWGHFAGARRVLPGQMRAVGLLR
jgi:cell wall-associated NlpC family hydrolase